MKVFTDTLISRLLSETAGFYFLIDLNLVLGTVYVTDMDIVYYYDNNPYIPDDIKIDNITNGTGMQVQSMTIKIQNVDQVMASYFLNNNQKGREVIVRFACLSRGDVDLVEIKDESDQSITDQVSDPILGTGNTGIATLPLFRGLISNWKMDELELSIILKTELILWHKRTLRKAQVLCPWPFKGTECGYSGSETLCNKTYARCQNLNNHNNYGGFRWLADMMEKKIQWGPK